MSKIVDQIRKELETRNGVSAEVMAPLAGAYRNQVLAVNERLSEAVGLLRKGLRSEAIQRASLTPNAIDAAADLDFPEVSEWIAILQFLDVPVPSLVDQDAVVMLNEAIVETQPMEELLHRHRRLAIAKAPLAWRLKVLRRIASIDSMNPVWEEDLESWEAVRLKQIPGELDEAIRAKNTKTVSSIYDELVNSSWRNAPNSRLIQKAKASGETFVHAEQMEELREIGLKLYDAFGEFNEPLARELRARWCSIVSELTQPVSVDIQDQAAPALAWLDELDRDLALAKERTTAIAKLTLALDKRTDLNTLQRGYQQANRFDEPLPIELEQRFRVATAEHQLKSRRKTQAILWSVVAATIIIAGFIGVQQWRSLQREKVEVASIQMQSLLDENKWTEAQQFFEQLEATSPEVAKSPALTSLASRLGGELNREQERKTEFQNYVTDADHEDPAQINLTSLNRAELLATSESEKAAVYQIQRRRSQWDREQKEEQSNAVLGRLSDFRQELDEIEAVDPSPESLQSLALLLAKVDQLTSEYPKHSASVKSQIQLVETRARSMREGMRTYELETATRTAALDRVLNAGSLNALADGLAAFSKRVPGSAMSQEFKQVADEQSLWARGLRSNDVIKQLGLALADGISPKEATAFLTAYREFTSDVVIDPSLDALTDVDARLSVVANRETLIDGFFKELALQAVAELVTIEVPNSDDPNLKERYFVYHSHYDNYRERFISSGSIGVEIVVSENASVSKQGFSGPINVIPEPRATYRWLLNKQLEGRDDLLADWSGFFLRAAAEVRNRKQLDGALKEMLILDLLHQGVEGSEYLRQRMSDSIRLLEQRAEQRSRWFAPRPLESSLDPSIEQLVIPKLAEAYMERNQEWASYKNLCKRRYEWAGVLLRHEQGEIQPHVTNKPAMNGELYVIRPSVADPSKVDFSKVGNWVDHHAVIGSAQRDLVAGRPIFFLPAVDET